MVLSPLWRPVTVALLSVALPLVACNKKSEQPAQNTQPGIGGIQINTGPGSGVMAAGESDVTRYPDEGPEIGSSSVRRASIARRSADQGSEIVGRLGVGTVVNKRARKGPYYLVEFPSAPGQLRLGWILQDDLPPVGAVATATVTATAPATTITVATTAPPATTTAPPAATTAPNGRPLRLPTRK